MRHAFREILNLSQLVGLLTARFGEAPDEISVAVAALVLLRRRCAGYDVLTLGVDLQEPGGGPRVRLKKLADRYCPEFIPPDLPTVIIYRLHVFENHIGT